MSIFWPFLYVLGGLDRTLLEMLKSVGRQVKSHQNVFAHNLSHRDISVLYKRIQVSDNVKIEAYVCLHVFLMAS